MSRRSGRAACSPGRESMNHRLEGGGFCNGLQALVPAKAGRMIPAPSGLQEVDGLNRLLQIVIPQQTADRYRRRDRHRHIHTIFQDVPFRDPYILDRSSPGSDPSQPLQPAPVCSTSSSAPDANVSHTACAPRRYSLIPPACWAALLAEAVA